MSKIVDYMDTKQATIGILKDYHDQLWKIDNDPTRLEIIDNRMTSPKSSSMSATPTYGGGNRVEEALCEAIDRKTVIEHGYNQAIRYRKEFEPCWKRLTAEERELLTARFIDHLERNWTVGVMRRYHISKSEAYRRSDQSLERLSKLLFW